MSAAATGTIAFRQDQPEVVRYMAGAAKRYRTVKAIRGVRNVGIVGLAAVAPLVVVLYPQSATALGAVGAVAIVANRLLFASWEASANDEAVRMQEKFDCAAFDIRWNKALGRPPREESVSAAATGNKRAEMVLHWYPDVGDASFPKDVLICQRASAAWADQLHREYGRVLLGLAVGWIAVGAVLAIANDVALATWLVGVLLPSLTAVLDSIDLWRGHEASSSERRYLTEAIDDHLAEAGPSEDTCRSVQDRLFELRRTEPKVSEHYYRLRRSRFENDMQDAAGRIARIHRD